jgi:hypothetical protein
MERKERERWERGGEKRKEIKYQTNIHPAAGGRAYLQGKRLFLMLRKRVSPYDRKGEHSKVTHSAKMVLDQKIKFERVRAATACRGRLKGTVGFVVDEVLFLRV